MSQRIVLTWKSDDGAINIETCNLVSEDNDVFTFEGSQVEGIMDFIMKQEFVAFEDDQGLFGLYPHQIIDIEIIYTGGRLR
jgi:hypothetical protein